MLYIILGIIVVIILCFIISFINYRELKEIDNNIKKCDDCIREVLNNKKDKLNLLVRDAKNKKLINSLKIDDDINIFDYEQLLYETNWDLNKSIDEEKYKPDTENKKILKEINELEESLEGLKDYYNSKSISYNELYNKKPFKFIYHLLKLDIKKTFKLRSMEQLEILKN